MGICLTERRLPNPISSTRLQLHFNPSQEPSRDRPRSPSCSETITERSREGSTFTADEHDGLCGRFIGRGQHVSNRDEQSRSILARVQRLARGWPAELLFDGCAPLKKFSLEYLSSKSEQRASPAALTISPRPRTIAHVAFFPTAPPPLARHAWTCVVPTHATVPYAAKHWFGSTYGVRIGRASHQSPTLTPSPGTVSDPQRSAEVLLQCRLLFHTAAARLVDRSGCSAVPVFSGVPQRGFLFSCMAARSSQRSICATSRATDCHRLAALGAVGMGMGTTAPHI